MASPDDTQAVGTMGFAPSEQWRRATEPRSDVYALAVTLWALLANRPPAFGDGGTADALRSIDGDYNTVYSYLDDR